MNRKIKSKKTKNLLKKFKEDDDIQDNEDNSNIEDELPEEQHDEIIKPTKQSLKDILTTVINKETKQKVAILSEKQHLLKQISQEKHDQKELLLKKKLKKQVTSKCHVDPKMINNKLLERELKVIAAKGIVKVFQAIKRVQNEGIK